MLLDEFVLHWPPNVVPEKRRNLTWASAMHMKNNKEKAAFCTPPTHLEGGRQDSFGGLRILEIVLCGAVSRPYSTIVADVKETARVPHPVSLALACWPVKRRSEIHDKRSCVYFFMQRSSCNNAEEQDLIAPERGGGGERASVAQSNRCKRVVSGKSRSFKGDEE